MLTFLIIDQQEVYMYRPIHSELQGSFSATRLAIHTTEKLLSHLLLNGAKSKKKIYAQYEKCIDILNDFLGVRRTLTFQWLPL